MLFKHVDILCKTVFKVMLIYALPLVINVYFTRSYNFHASSLAPRLGQGERCFDRKRNIYGVILAFVSFVH